VGLISGAGILKAKVGNLIFSKIWIRVADLIEIEIKSYFDGN
jgi:translation initiation factor IF-1